MFNNKTFRKLRNVKNLLLPYDLYTKKDILNSEIPRQKEVMTKKIAQLWWFYAN